jgi:hypothetical protein
VAPQGSPTAAQEALRDAYRRPPAERAERVTAALKELLEPAALRARGAVDQRTLTLTEEETAGLVRAVEQVRSARSRQLQPVDLGEPAATASAAATTSARPAPPARGAMPAEITLSARERATLSALGELPFGMMPTPALHQEISRVSGALRRTRTELALAGRTPVTPGSGPAPDGRSSGVTARRQEQIVRDERRLAELRRELDRRQAQPPDVREREDALRRPPGQQPPHGPAPGRTGVASTGRPPAVGRQRPDPPPVPPAPPSGPRPPGR